jgi:PAS domain S-box-containing protein
VSSLSITEAPSSRQVLVVEDDPSTAELMRRSLERAGYSVVLADGVAAGLKALGDVDSGEFMTLLLDYRLPDGEPWTVADAAQARIPEVPVVIVTGMSDESVAIEALRRGFADYVKKADGFWKELPAILERVARLSRLKGRLDEASSLMTAIVEHSCDLIVVCGGDSKMIYISPMCITLLGVDASELMGRPGTEIVAPEDREEVARLFARTEDKTTLPSTVRCRRKDGSLVWMEARAARLRASSAAQPMTVLTLHNITAQREHEEQMAASLREKEVLLREIHHRVKNNLQVIQSLLRMRARLLSEGEARAAMESTVQRIHAMSLAHEHLYQREDLARLSLSNYLRDLFNRVVASSSVQPNQIQLHLDIEERSLTLELAIPFGLLVNELIANSLKHAFPGGRRGTVTISVHRVDGAVRMVIADDGVGLPEHFDMNACPSMGLKLAASLSHQLGGSLRFSSQNGCRVEMNLTRM